MKLTKTKLCTALLGVAVFAANVASAIPGYSVPGYFNISGTVTTDKSTATGGKALVKKSFSNKEILTILANATDNSWISNKTSHLLYDPAVLNVAASLWYGEDVYGIFRATNTTTHASYRLDNADTNTEYWSYIELDYYGNNPITKLGFYDPYQLAAYGDAVGENYADRYVESQSKYSGSELGSDAILYVHDGASDFDYPDYGGDVLFDSNDNAIVIRGQITLGWNFTSTRITESISLQGTGDGAFYNSFGGTGWYYPVIAGKAMWSGKN
jgi:hypothetical protein